MFHGGRYLFVGLRGEVTLTTAGNVPVATVTSEAWVEVKNQQTKPAKTREWNYCWVNFPNALGCVMYSFHFFSVFLGSCVSGAHVTTHRLKWVLVPVLRAESLVLMLVKSSSSSSLEDVWWFTYYFFSQIDWTNTTIIIRNECYRYIQMLYYDVMWYDIVQYERIWYEVI